MPTETIDQRDKRLAKATAAQRRNRNRIALASAMGGEAQRAPFADVHDELLSQTHPGRIAEGATTTEQHSVASGFHSKRAQAADPSGTAGNPVSHAHDEAAAAHKKAAETGDPDDSLKARACSKKALACEYDNTGHVGA